MSMRHLDKIGEILSKPTNTQQPNVSMEYSRRGGPEIPHGGALCCRSRQKCSVFALLSRVSKLTECADISQANVFIPVDACRGCGSPRSRPKGLLLL